MGLFLPLIVSLLFISSSYSNPISLDRAAPWPSGDRGILEQDAPETTQLSVSEKLNCENSGAERCLLFPIGCVPGVNCTVRLKMRRVQSGSNRGNIIISLNLHVSRTAHMLVAVPMPDLSNPNSTFLVGCSIDDAVSVVAKPDVDGVTEQLRLDWLNLVAVRATSDDLECIVSAQPGFIDLPQGDIAVFAGDLEPEEEIGQSARISGSLDDGSEEEREGEKSRERIHVESSIHKISPPLIHERTTQSLEHSESTEPILVSVEDHAEPVLTAIEEQGPSTTQVPVKSAVVVLSIVSVLSVFACHYCNQNNYKNSEIDEEFIEIPRTRERRSKENVSPRRQPNTTTREKVKIFLNKCDMIKRAANIVLTMAVTSTDEFGKACMKYLIVRGRYIAIKRQFDQFNKNANRLEYARCESAKEAAQNSVERAKEYVNTASATHTNAANIFRRERAAAVRILREKRKRTILCVKRN